MRLLRTTAWIGILSLTALAQQTPEIVGGISSSAAVEIDGTSMAPAPSWPIVDRDLIRTTSAPGLILTPDQNAVTLMQGTTVRVRIIEPHKTWVLVRQGGVNVRTKNDGVLVCIANRLFQPSATATGTLNVDAAGKVTRTVSRGLITELPVSSCGEELATGMVSSPPGTVAGGTASPPAANAGSKALGTGIAIGTAAGLAAAIGGVSAFGSSCASAGCNFNPPSVTPSVP
jgi:hypothetical protein